MYYTEDCPVTLDKKCTVRMMTLTSEMRGGTVSIPQKVLLSFLAVLLIVPEQS